LCYFTNYCREIKPFTDGEFVLWRQQKYFVPKNSSFLKLSVFLQTQ
jgi:hypothetical protein